MEEKEDIHGSLYMTEVEITIIITICLLVCLNETVEVEQTE